VSKRHLTTRPYFVKWQALILSARLSQAQHKPQLKTIQTQVNPVHVCVADFSNIYLNISLSPMSTLPSRLFATKIWEHRNKNRLSIDSDKITSSFQRITFLCHVLFIIINIITMDNDSMGRCQALAPFSVFWSYTQLVELLGRGSAQRKASAFTENYTNTE
jgi:hypothetical protein